MPDTRRLLPALQTLWADNTVGNISAQDLRDGLVSLYPTVESLRNYGVQEGDNLVPAIEAIFSGMIDGTGHPHGTLLIDVPGTIDSAVVFDLGYTAADVASSAGNTPSDGRRFKLVCEAAVTPDAAIGDVFTVKNGYGAEIEVRANGGGQSSDTLLKLQSLSGAVISAHADSFLGTVIAADATDPNNLVHLSRIEYVRTNKCGRAISFTSINAFGQINNVWDIASVAGSVFTDCADIGITHWENYSPATQDVSLLFTDCNLMNIGTLALGGRPTEAVVKIEGEVSGSSNFGSINRLRATRDVGDNAASGLILEDVKSIAIDNLLTRANGVGCEIIGSSPIIKEHHSLTGDVRPMTIAGTATHPTPNIYVNVRHRFCDNEAVKFGTGITGGLFRISGRVDLPNRSSTANTNVIDGLTVNGMTIDVMGLDIPSAFNCDASVRWPTGLVRNDPLAQLGDGIDYVNIVVHTTDALLKVAQDLNHTTDAFIAVV